MCNYLKVIKDYLRASEYLTVKDANNLGVGRHILAAYVKQGKLERVERGIYSLPNEWIDEFELFQIKNKKVVYSYGTALYFQGLSDRTPNIIHISVPQGYNTQHIKDKSLKIKVHYVKKINFEIGIKLIRSPQGGQIMVYDIERCLCDMIRDKKYVDIQVYQNAIKGYFSLKDKDLRKLVKYSKIFKVEDAIRNYIEMLS